MKKFMMVACMVALIFGVAVNGYAYTYTITDDYVGSDDHGYGDVISSAGDRDKFDIDSMNITIDDTYKMTVKINTGYVNHIDLYGTDFGDLFISTNGWKPSGDASDGFKADNADNGENWEYVFDVSAAALYDITDSQGSIQLTDDAYDRNTYRNGQETLIDPTGLTKVVGGTVVKNTDENYLSISFDISEMVKGLDEFQLAFHWNMTCGNDTIEGVIDPIAAPVPEPSTVLLLGLGLFGFVGLSRKRIKK